MGYAQWVSVHLINSMSSNSLSVKDAKLDWGKFYEGSKDNEIDAKKVNEISIAPNNSGNVNSCGRSDASSGTQGSIQLYDGNNRIAKVWWDCPWGSKTNDIQVLERDNRYWVQLGAWNRDSGALGTVDVEVGKKG